MPELRPIVIALALLVAPFLGKARAQTDDQVAPIAFNPLARDKPVDFEREILPIFRESCLACHNSTDAKGELVLETPDLIRKGGETGPAVDPSNPGSSLLLRLSAHLEKPYMPPRKNKAGAPALTSEDLALVQLWIQQGATGVVSSALAPVAWQGLPAQIQSISAVAITADGQFVACNRGNKVYVYRVPTRELVQLLTDPDLPGETADRDAIHSLTFNPEGTVLAAGGFRAVKLWNLEPPNSAMVVNLAAAGPILSSAASHDGSNFALGGADGLITIWNGSNGQKMMDLRGHTAPVTALGYSASGANLISGGRDKTVRCWNLSTGTFTLLPLPAEILSLASLGDAVAVGCSDNLIRIVKWSEPGELKVEREIAGHSGPVTALHKTENRLVSGSQDKSVRVWNVENWSQLSQLDHGEAVATVALRPDHKRLASGGANHALKLWNVENGQLVAELKGDQFARAFADRKERDLQFAKAEVDYHAGAVKQSEEREKAETEALKKAGEAKDKADKNFTETSEAHKKALETKSSAETAKATLLREIDAAAANKSNLGKARDDTAALLAAAQTKAAEAKNVFDTVNTNKASLYRRIIDAAFRAKLSELDALEARSGPGDTAMVAEKAAGEKVAAAEALIDDAAANKVAFDQAFATLNSANTALTNALSNAKAASDALSAAETLLAQAEPSKKQADEKIAAAAKQIADTEAAMKLAEGVRNGAAQSFESTKVVLAAVTAQVGTARRSLQLAEEQRAQEVRSTDQARQIASSAEKDILAAVFSPDSRVLIYSGEDGVIRSVTSETGQPLDATRGHNHGVQAMIFVKDRLLTTSTDQSWKIWNRIAPSWKFASRLGVGTGATSLVDRVMALRFSPDGQMLATGGGFPSRSGELKIWRVADGSLVKEIKDPHSDTVFALDWSPDQKHIASGGADKFLRVFDVLTARQVRAFEGHTAHVLGVSWKRDMRNLASSSADKTIKVWDFATGEQRKTIEGFGKEVTALQFAFGLNETLAASGDAQVKIVREDGHQLRVFGGSTDYVSAAAMTPDGRVVAAGCMDGTLRLWDGQSGQHLATFEPMRELQKPATVAGTR